jgi:hypothetical protein
LSCDQSTELETPKAITVAANMAFKPICFIAISLSYSSYGATLYDQPGGIIDLNQWPPGCTGVQAA